MHGMETHRRRKSAIPASSSSSLQPRNNAKTRTSVQFRNLPSFRPVGLFTCSIFAILWICFFLVHVGDRRTSLAQQHQSSSSVETHLRKVTLSPLPRNASMAENHSTDKANATDKRRWLWIGIVRDAKEIQESTWDALGHVACSFDVHIHITVGKNGGHAVDQLITRRIAAFEMNSSHNCAPAYIESEQELGIASLPTNRVERIAMIRDAQRERVRQLLEKNRPVDASFNEDIIIVADLDLFRLPGTTNVLAQADSLASNDHLDVVCAAGVTMASRNELWYYDTYATVLLPDTYVHPLKRRLVKEYYPSEDPHLVRSDSQHGPFTQGDIMRYLQRQAAATGTARVRSCFGGLTIYRALTWFEKYCSYTPDDPKSLERYASAADGRPCEHVAFHTCLQDTEGIPRARVAINPSLITLWRKN